MHRIRQIMLDEPLIPFAILGGVLFVVYGFRQPPRVVETIEISTSTVRALERAQQELVGRPLTEQERMDVLEGYIEEEVLLREAFRMELEKKDSRVRQRLLNVMRSTLDQPVAPPTRAELQAYFREQRDRYDSGELITCDHVFYAYGSENEPEALSQLLTDLRAGADHSQLGDSVMYGNTLRDRSKSQLLRSMGKEFSEAIFSLPLNEWHGPLETTQGLHFVRVAEKRQPPAPDFDKMEEYLRQDWMFRKRRETQSEKIAEMRQNYRIAFTEGQ